MLKRKLSKANWCLVISVGLIAVFNILAIPSRTNVWPVVQDFSMFQGRARRGIKIYLQSQTGHFTEMTDYLAFGFRDKLMVLYARFYLPNENERDLFVLNTINGLKKLAEDNASLRNIITEKDSKFVIASFAIRNENQLSIYDINHDVDNRFEIMHCQYVESGDRC
jgi:hypothetical protein